MARTGKPMTMDRQPDDLAARKESVAAHQAVCGCHPAAPLAVPSCCAGAWDIALDSSGAPWHVDPMCRIRPEARPKGLS